MSDEPITDAELVKLKGIADQVQRIEPGPWDRQTGKVSGETIAFNFLDDANGKYLADSFNSDLSTTNEEWDEDGRHYFDGGTLEIFEYLSMWHPLIALRLLAEVERLRADNTTLHEAASIWLARAAAAELRVDDQEKLLRRLYEWDVMSTGDGEYWRHEIAKHLASPQSFTPGPPDQIGPVKEVETP